MTAKESDRSLGLKPRTKGLAQIVGKSVNVKTHARPCSAQSEYIKPSESTTKSRNTFVYGLAVSSLVSSKSSAREVAMVKSVQEPAQPAEQYQGKRLQPNTKQSTTINLKSHVAPEAQVTDTSGSVGQNTSRNMTNSIAALGPKLLQKTDRTTTDRSPSRPRSTIADIQRKTSPESVVKTEQRGATIVDTEYLEGNEDLGFEDLSFIQPRMVTSNSGVNIGVKGNPFLLNNYQYKVERTSNELARPRNSFRILQRKEAPDEHDLAQARKFAGQLGLALSEKELKAQALWLNQANMSINAFKTLVDKDQRRQTIPNETRNKFLVYIKKIVEQSDK